MPEAFASAFVTIGLLPLSFLALAVAYIGLRIRDAREEHSDPELGLKAGLYFFMNVGILLALSGVTIAVSDLLGEAMAGPKPLPNQPNPGAFGRPGFNQPPPQNDPFLDSVSQRIAWPLVISGVLAALLSLLAIYMVTNHHRFPAVKRTFAGWRMAVAGVSALTGLVLLTQLFFQKNQDNLRSYGVALGVLIVWLPTLAIQVSLMKSYSKAAYYVPPKPKQVRLGRDGREESEDDEDDRPRRRPRRERDDVEHED
jgi:hypothetical protein